MLRIKHGLRTQLKCSIKTSLSSSLKHNPKSTLVKRARALFRVGSHHGTHGGIKAVIKISGHLFGTWTSSLMKLDAPLRVSTRLCKRREAMHFYHKLMYSQSGSVATPRKLNRLCLL